MLGAEVGNARLDGKWMTNLNDSKEVKETLKNKSFWQEEAHRVNFLSLFCLLFLVVSYNVKKLL